MNPSTRDPVVSDWLARKQSQAHLRLGLAFNNLHVHGFISSARFQPTVASYTLAIPRLVWKLLSRRSDRRVQILRGIDGLITSGEMLLVLGRPGSGCTTFLKALAGDTHGIFIGHESHVNYEGEKLIHSHCPFSGGIASLLSSIFCGKLNLTYHDRNSLQADAP